MAKKPRRPIEPMQQKLNLRDQKQLEDLKAMRQVK